MARLRRADCSGPGIARVKRGRGFSYYDDERKVDEPEVLARIRELAMRKEHVRIEADDVMVFDYPAKSGRRRVLGVADPEALEVVAKLLRRRGGGDELLAYKRGRRWADVRSDDINEYLKAATGDDFSAKDFRTWSATVLCAVALGVSGEVADTKTGRKRAAMRAVKEVAHYLGNTPAVCRASYIAPRVFDAYRRGLVIDLPRADGQRAVEEAMLDLIDERERSPTIERIAA